ncbi:MAG: ATP-dependent Clp protease ATP-binding subunit, partial [Candidatus Dadabacteria bacterium]
HLTFDYIKTISFLRKLKKAEQFLKNNQSKGVEMCLKREDSKPSKPIGQQNSAKHTEKNYRLNLEGLVFPNANNFSISAERGKGNNDNGNHNKNNSNSPNNGKDQGEGKKQITNKRRKKVRTPFIDRFCIDLTKMASEGKLDPVIGRDNEIKRVIEILIRRTKSNPLLIGDAGVGKTAIVEGLAKAIDEGKVPEDLLSTRIVVLDLASLVAGTKYRGMFEERLKGVLREVQELSNVVIFIDEIHTVVGAGSGEGSLDASNILKPALSRGEIKLIGATTIDEYRKHIEKDGALNRRFQVVNVEEPSAEEALEILEGLAEKYEAHHSVRYTDDALKEAVSLSIRFCPERKLPDKAIDVIDEAGARAASKRVGEPKKLKELRESLDEIAAEKEEAIKQGDYKAAAQFKQEEEKLRRKLSREEKKWRDVKKSYRIIVTAEDVREVISSISGVPLSKVKPEEQDKLLRAEDILNEKVIGQEEAVSKVSAALRKRRAGLGDPKRPAGAFLFVGPTGVGKTYTVKALAELLYGDPEAVIQLDMSEYMESHSVSKLVGSPPGYVGHEDGGQLTERVRRKPYSIVLFDEIEKAHPEVVNVLLQILEEGRLTDGMGRVVNFKNCIIVLTSNIGADKLQRGSIGFAPKDNNGKLTNVQRQQLLESVQRHFKPELLGRLDDIVIFNKLGQEELRKILHLELSSVAKRVEDLGFELEVEESVKELVLREGSNEKFGARPLRRAISQYIEDPLAEFILSGKAAKANKLVISARNGEIIVKAINQEPKEPLRLLLAG